MTWEWVALIAVLVLCGTSLIHNYLDQLFQNKISPEIATSLETLEQRLSTIESANQTIVSDHVKILELAEQSKKLLSEASIYKSFRPSR